MDEARVVASRGVKGEAAGPDRAAVEADTTTITAAPMRQPQPPPTALVVVHASFPDRYAGVANTVTQYAGSSRGVMVLQWYRQQAISRLVGQTGARDGDLVRGLSERKAPAACRRRR